MSDLESVATSAPIISTAAGKLRSLSGNAQRFGETHGLVDAFAEVFAQMAIAAPQPVSPPDSNTDSRADEDETVLQSEDTENPDSEDTSAVAPEANAVVIHAPPPASDPTKDDQAIDSSLAFEAEAEDTGGDLTVDASEQSRSHLPVPEQTSVQVDASTTESESESKPVVQANVSASTLDGHPNRESRREAKNVDQQISPSQDDQPIESEATRQAVPTQSTSTPDGQDPQTPQDPTSESPERTTRQQFLEARRDRTGDHDRGENHAKESPDARASEPIVNQPVLDDVASSPNQGAAPAPTAARPSPADQPLIHSSQTSIVSIAAKSSGNAMNGRTETQTAPQPTQSQGENRVDNGQGRGTRPVTDDASSMAARVKLVQRVSRAFQHLGIDGGVIRLRLAPAELGSVRVEMQINQRKVEARVVAETEAASAALKEHLPDLRARLESYGMQVERLDVETETRDSHSGLPFDRQPQQRESEQQPHRRPFRGDRQESSPLALRPSVQQTATLNPKLASRSVDLRL